MLGVGIIIPIFAPLIVGNDIGMVPAHFSIEERKIILGFLLATFSIFQFIGAPVLGALADRHGRKKILSITLAGTFAGYLLFAAAIQTRMLGLVFLARAIPGFMGGNIAIAMAALADLSDDRSKARNFGLIGMAFGLGFILGPAIGGILGKYNYAYPLLFTALLALLNNALVYLQFPETFRPKEVRPISAWAGLHNIARAFSYTNMRVILLVQFLQALGFTFFTQFFSVFMIEKFHTGQQQIAQVFTFAGLWLVITQGFILRRLSSILQPAQILRVSIPALSFAVLAVLVPGSYPGLFLVQPFISIFQGLTQPNAVSIISSMGTSENQGEILGIQASVQSLAFAIPPVIAGFISSIDYRLPIIAGSASLMLSAILFIFLFQPAYHMVKENVLK